MLSLLPRTELDATLPLCSTAGRDDIRCRRKFPRTLAIYGEQLTDDTWDLESVGAFA